MRQVEKPIEVKEVETQYDNSLRRLGCNKPARQTDEQGLNVSAKPNKSDPRIPKAEELPVS